VESKLLIHCLLCVQVWHVEFNTVLTLISLEALEILYEEIERLLLSIFFFYFQRSIMHLLCYLRLQVPLMIYTSKQLKKKYDRSPSLSDSFDTVRSKSRKRQGRQLVSWFRHSAKHASQTNSIFSVHPYIHRLLNQNTQMSFPELYQSILEWSCRNLSFSNPSPIQFYSIYFRCRL